MLSCRQCSLKLLLIVFEFISLLRNSKCGVNLTVGSCIIQYSEVCASDFVKFYISTSDFPSNKSYLFRSTENPILPSWINLNNEFKVIIHGYGGGIEFQQTKAIQAEYLKLKSKNIIAVDWGRLSVLPCYPTAAVNTKQAGECIANFLTNLQDANENFEAISVHIIGFSLGAHVAGFASNAIERMTGYKIRRITGLDPALPLFATPQKQRKLDASDALFVDVIHTNVGIFGKIEPCGHVDFYMNGGQIQPNCRDSNNIPLCSHMMANVYFKESVDERNIGFYGTRCSSYFQYIFGWCGGSNSTIVNSDQVLMGEQCSETEHGIIFVYTNNQSPYAKGPIFTIE